MKTVARSGAREKVIASGLIVISESQCGALLKPYRDLEWRVAQLHNDAAQGSVERGLYGQFHAMLVGADMHLRALGVAEMTLA
jgi:hypothetical protein